MALLAAAATMGRFGRASTRTAGAVVAAISSTSTAAATPSLIPAASQAAVTAAGLWQREPVIGRGFSSEPSKDEDEERELGNEKVRALVDELLKLNILEFSDLTKILAKRLGVPDQPMMPMGMAMAAPAGGAPAASPAAEPAEEKTSFTVKLESFDAAAKIKVIKEVRAVTGLGLKEAKELVEGAPCIVKPGVAKEEAEQLKKKLEDVGGKVLLE